MGQLLPKPQILLDHWEAYADGEIAVITSFSCCEVSNGG